MRVKTRLSRLVAVVGLLMLVFLGASRNTPQESLPDGTLAWRSGLHDPLSAGLMGDDAHATQVQSQASIDSSSRVRPLPLDQYRQSPSNITWGPPRNMSLFPGANEPAAAMHPLNPLLVLSGGNKSYPFSGIMVNRSTDGGNTWAQAFPQPVGLADGVMAWLPVTINNGQSALNTDLANSPDGLQLDLHKSTDGGVTWSYVTNSNIHEPTFSDDRPYFWVDHDPSSPYYGRVYLTQTLFRT